MGLNFFVSKSEFDKLTSNFDGKIKKVFGTSSLPNPNPANYTIVRSLVINGYLIIEIKYHDCTNYEGRKIMLYDSTLVELINQKLIDPHFSNNKKYISPIARFEPTKRGWKLACTLANCI